MYDFFLFGSVSGMTKSSTHSTAILSVATMSTLQPFNVEHSGIEASDNRFRRPHKNSRPQITTSILEAKEDEVTNLGL